MRRSSLDAIATLFLVVAAAAMMLFAALKGVKR